ncbi:MAG: FAD-dependent oxidoreductase [Limnobacter sp.]|nr:FAD-dependent oxidoreductase [Limnobacter sp.]
MVWSIAVIGAGISGLACARALSLAGHHVTVYEKSRGAGGRMPTRWVDKSAEPPLGFDHGSQYFYADSASFDSVVQKARGQGSVAPWEGRVVDLAYGVVSNHESKGTRWVGVPGMAAFAKSLAGSLPIVYEQRVLKIERHADKWQLYLQSSPGEEVKTSAGFDWVICAIPAEQAAELLDGIHPRAAQAAASVQSSVTWSAMLTFDEKVPVDYDGAFVVDSPLGWICRDSSKPGRAPGERWVLHATADWSFAHVNETREAVTDRLVDVFFSAIGHYVEPSIAKAHRWLYSVPLNPLSQSHMCDPEQGIGVCGDWMADGRIESAYLSGEALAAHMNKV